MSAAISRSNFLLPSRFGREVMTALISSRHRSGRRGREEGEGGGVGRRGREEG